MITGEGLQVQLYALEGRVNDLAMQWRSCQNSEDEQHIVAEYQATLQHMIRLGFRDSLDMDAELPDHLLPSEYLELFR